jgi:hypothetical protein
VELELICAADTHETRCLLGNFKGHLTGGAGLAVKGDVTTDGHAGCQQKHRGSGRNQQRKGT